MMAVLLILFVALQLADIWTTLRAFDRNPRAYEANPPLRWLMMRLGTVPALAVVKVAAIGIIAAIGLEHPHDGLALGVVGGFCAFYAWIVVRNWRVGNQSSR